jgi:hypothetical protein
MRKQIFYRQLHLGFILLIAVSFLESCDPAQMLEIKTADKPNCSVTIYANRNILPYNDGKQNEKLILRIPTIGSKPVTDTTFSYGIGGWPDKNGMQKFSKNIDSIIIISNGIRLGLINQEAITEYLVKHRHGFGKSILTIEAK